MDILKKMVKAYLTKIVLSRLDIWGGGWVMSSAYVWQHSWLCSISHYYFKITIKEIIRSVQNPPHYNDYVSLPNRESWGYMFTFCEGNYMFTIVVSFSRSCPQYIFFRIILNSEEHRVSIIILLFDYYIIMANHLSIATTFH